MRISRIAENDAEIVQELARIGITPDHPDFQGYLELEISLHNAIVNNVVWENRPNSRKA